MIYNKLVFVVVICWAIAFIRAIEALFNIGKRLEDQRSFSIQHLINNVRLGKYGLEDSKTLGDFVIQHGLLEEGECSYKRTKQTCAHVDVSLLFFSLLYYLSEMSYYSCYGEASIFSLFRGLGSTQINSMFLI